jgi:hypothetical protein
MKSLVFKRSLVIAVGQCENIAGQRHLRVRIECREGLKHRPVERLEHIEPMSVAKKHCYYAVMCGRFTYNLTGQPYA